MSNLSRHWPFLLFALIVLLAQSPQTLAQATNQAALVVDYGNGLVQTSCIGFEEESLTGFEVLQRSGLPLTVGTGNVGAGICAIDGVGCPASDCFCQCTGGADCRFWSYWHGSDDGWQFSNVGASLHVVEPGDLEGWRWGQGSPQTADPPPSYSFEAICEPPPTPTAIVITQPPTAVPQNNATPTRTPTAVSTAIPTATPSPTSTPFATLATTLPTTAAPTATIDQTASPTVDLSAAATLRPTVTPWPTTNSEEIAAIQPTVPLTPTSAIVIVALPTLSNVAQPTALTTAVLLPTPSPLALANNQIVATPPAAVRIGSQVAAEQTNGSAAVNGERERGKTAVSYLIFGVILAALLLVWWQGKRHKGNG